MSFCIKTADILLPNKNIDYNKFAVIACDQYTSEKEYWQELEKYTQGSYTSLELILPEAYLKEDNTSDIKKIHCNMKRYLDSGIFTTHKNCFIYTERKTPYTSLRKGLITAVDLEAYCYDGQKTPVRSSEGTVLSRIPPRAKIRKGAALELPHIMLLINDSENEVFNCLENQKAEMECLYDTELNQNGGHVTGYKVHNSDQILDKLKKVANSASDKYGEGENLFIAVGDGNHSLASAKSVWEEIKKDLPENERLNHPARFALAEIVNIHDSGLSFHPIHRVFFVKDSKDFINGLKKVCEKFTYSSGVVLSDGNAEKLNLPENAAEATDAVQNYADNYTEKNGGYTDYVHGEDSVQKICAETGAVGVLLPSLKKEDFFGYIVNKGSLPRKCFSLGEACEKRYYIEARKLF